jgi:hypothetical protein
MTSYQSYAVNYYVDGFSERQLATVPTACVKSDLIYFIEDNGGVVDGEWYKFSTVDEIRATIKETKNRSGIIYDLNIRTIP